MDTKLYITNLPARATEEELRLLFEQVGKVKEITLVDEHGLRAVQGSALITMNSQEEAIQAVLRFNGHILNNLPLRVTLERPRGSNYDSSQRGFRSNI